MGEAQLHAPGPGHDRAAQRVQPGMTLSAPLYGRIPHQAALLEPVEAKGCHHFTELARRAMDALGLDYQVVFPTPMLTLGMHPQDDIEVALGEGLQPVADRAHPARGPAAQGPDLSAVQHAGGLRRRGQEVRRRSTASSAITVDLDAQQAGASQRYMKLYAMMEETGKPFAFHSGFNWNDPSFLQLNRFISMHALSFVHYSLIHMTNWIINGLPERFPKLKLLWIESGLAWIPFLMQRLDHEYQMRTCEAPLLKRLPSEYMRDMYYTSQPLEKTNLKLLQGDDGSVQRRHPVAVRLGLAALGLRSRRARSPRCRSSPSRPSATSSASTPRALFNLEVKRKRPRAPGRAGGAAGRVVKNDT